MGHGDDDGISAGKIAMIFGVDGELDEAGSMIASLSAIANCQKCEVFFDLPEALSD